MRQARAMKTPPTRRTALLPSLRAAAPIRYDVVALALVVLLAAAARPVHGMPYFLLQNKAPKCFQIGAQPNTKLVVTYSAPGKKTIRGAT